MPAVGLSLSVWMRQRGARKKKSKSHRKSSLCYTCLFCWTHGSPCVRACRRTWLNSKPRVVRSESAWSSARCVPEGRHTHPRDCFISSLCRHLRIGNANHPLEKPVVFHLLSKQPKVTSLEPKNFQLPHVRQDEHLRQGSWGPSLSPSVLAEVNKNFQHAVELWWCREHTARLSFDLSSYINIPPEDPRRMDVTQGSLIAGWQEVWALTRAHRCTYLQHGLKFDGCWKMSLIFGGGLWSAGEGSAQTAKSL